MYCNKCGKKLSNNMKFCPNCGMSNPLSEPPVSMLTYQEVHHFSSLVVFLLIIAALIFIPILINW